MKNNSQVICLAGLVHLDLDLVNGAEVECDCTLLDFEEIQSARTAATALGKIRANNAIFAGDLLNPDNLYRLYSAGFRTFYNIGQLLT